MKGMIFAQAANVLTLGVSGRGKKVSSSGEPGSSVSNLIRVDWRFLRSWSKWPFAESILGARCQSIDRESIPGQVRKFPLRMASFQVEVTGLPMQP